MNNKRVLITGANGGIGLATSLAAARAGWDVFAAVRDMANEETVMRAAERSQCQLNVLALDVTDADQCHAVVEQVKPTALVNNAGFAFAGAIEEVSDDIAREHFEVMTIAPMRLARLSLPHMRDNGGGRIVNISSLGGRTSAPLTGWYTASKHALEAANDALRGEVARDNVKVCIVEPGGVSTGILEKTVSASYDAGSPFAESHARAHRLTAMTQKFQGDATRVAKVVVRALDASHPKARYVVGVDARLLLLGGVFITPVRDLFKRKMLKL